MGRRVSRKNVNYQKLEGPSDDEFIWCEVCSEEYLEKCANCGPMRPIENTAVEEGDPLRARKTLPACLYLGKSSKHGLGVFAKYRLKLGVYFGIYEGIRKEVGHDDLDSGYAFDIEKDGELAYHIDGKDEATSNWMRFVNCATNLDEQNMTAFQYKSNIYFVTNTIVEANTELLVWYGNDYATILGLLPPKPGSGKTPRKRCKRRGGDSSYKPDGKSNARTKKPKYSSQSAAKLDSTQKTLEKVKVPRSQVVYSETRLSGSDESDDNTATNEECIEESDVSTDVHDLDNESSDNTTSNEVPRSDRFVRSGSDSSGFSDISEVRDITEVDCSLPGPRSSSPTSTISSDADVIFISDEESGSIEYSSGRTNREGSSEPVWPLKRRFSNWTLCFEPTTNISSQKVTKSKPNISGSTKTTENEGNSQDVTQCTEINRNIKILQRDLKVKQLETEQVQLQLDAKLIEKELFELDARIRAVDDEILGKEREIQQLDDEMTSLQTKLKNMKKTDAVIIYSRNGSSGGIAQEIKHLKQEAETRRQELEIKTLEMAEPEMKLQRIRMMQDKDYLHAKLNKICLKAETQKSKKIDIEEQIREVKRNLMRA